MVYSALEQFKIYPLIYFLTYNLSFTNQIVIVLLIFSFLFLTSAIVSNNHDGFVIPGRFQTVLELIYTTVLGTLYDNAGKKTVKFFPFVFTVITFIGLSNLVGLVPYSFTITSHLAITSFLALVLFIGIVSVIIETYRLKSLQLFLPKGTSLSLSLLLVPIEIISFIFKPLSLGVRLFANIIAGHTLLKVIAGFSWAIIIKGGLMFIIHFFPLIILVLLIGLEFVVALIQTYVFLILSGIYFREGLHLH